AFVENLGDAQDSRRSRRGRCESGRLLNQCVEGIAVDRFGAAPVSGRDTPSEEFTGWQRHVGKIRRVLGAAAQEQGVAAGCRATSAEGNGTEKPVEAQLFQPVVL